jgi:glycosyltransferase involved in cell wall biosynthesis
VRVTRIAFISCHSYLDPSSGAARSIRDLLEMLVARGADCRALSTGVLDFRHETPLQAALNTLGVPIRPARATLTPNGEVGVFDLVLRGVRVTLLPTASSRLGRSPDRAESAALLDLAEQVCECFRPQVLLTYGGHPVSLELMARARRRDIPVVFHLRNCAYTKASTFADVDAIVVPSEFTRRFYAERLGLECTVIPSPVDPDRVVAPDRQPHYLTFVNPIPEKGLTVFARIARELGRRRPDIPLLVVEGRQTADALTEVGLDLSGLTNLYRMANTPDPRHFYRVTQALLLPVLWPETFGRVGVEALANGLPVLASDRGALPEVLGGAGLLFSIPARCTPESGAVPTAEEVAPWVAAIERIWDDPAWEAELQARARAAAGRYDKDRILNIYENLLSGLRRSSSEPSPGDRAPSSGEDWLILHDGTEEQVPAWSADMANPGTIGKAPPSVSDRPVQSASGVTELPSAPVQPGGITPLRLPPPQWIRPGVLNFVVTSDSAVSELALITGQQSSAPFLGKKSEQV